VEGHEILTVLLRRHKLRFSQMRSLLDSLHEKEYSDTRSFDVVLARLLKHACNAWWPLRGELDFS